ncbi:MAG: site-2 protease family protein [Acidimicrobiales bacterium]|nr:site-2 protease family protein [Acidimicrobiales bacterium]
MRESVRLGRVFGIPVGVHWSLLVVFGLLWLGLAAGELPAAHPGEPAALYWLAGLVAVVAFFAGLLAHELAHAVVARREGLPVEGITLWLLGGVSRLGGEPATPAIELRVAVVGPATSIGLAAAGGVLWLLLSAVEAPGLVTVLVAWLATINLVLGLFNLLPALPLDGGRVLRAILWRRWGDQRRATAASAGAGIATGAVLIGLGLLGVAAGVLVGGVWFVLLGWFLLDAARAEVSGVDVRRRLAGVRVGDVMSPHPVAVPAWVTVDELVRHHVAEHPWSTYPVRDADGSVVGLVTRSQLQQVPGDAWPCTLVRSVARPLGQVATAAPGDALLAVLPALATSPDRRLLVLDHGHLVGIVTPTDVSRALELGALTGPGGRADTAA